jgi:hypothetical protein
MLPTTILFYATIFLLICKANANRSLLELALLKWKASLADANSLSTWSAAGNSTCCSWLGVTCDATGHVVELSLPSAGLRGQLDAFDFAVFPNLTKLNLNNNSLAGAIHNLCTNLMIPNLVYQYLNLSSNGFSLFRDNITIPVPLAQLTKLQELQLETNVFSGGFPEMLTTISTLQVLSLRNNTLSGLIPMGIGNLTSLQFLNLSHNLFTGPLPMSIGKMKHLEGFYLYNNNLNGEIPQEIGNMTTLLQLDLRNNQLEGEIPATHYSEISTI